MIGTDVVPEAITRAKAIGVEAYLADENSIAEVTGRSSVGIIHMFHVIEHLPDPVDVLRKLREVLVEGGIVIGQTPNVASWDARLFGRYWTQWHVPRHLVLYTPETLRAHAEAAGYEVLSIKGSPLSVANWSGSILKAISLSRGKAFHPTQGVIYPLLMMAMAPVVALQMAFSAPSNIDFVFRRRA
jgi:hypothetical protein